MSGVLSGLQGPPLNLHAEKRILNHEKEACHATPSP